MQTVRSEDSAISENCRKNGASPLLNMEQSCPNVRVRKSVTDDAELWFVHNRSDECTAVICELGEYTIFAPNGEESTVCSDGTFRLHLPEKSARMLVRQKNGDHMKYDKLVRDRIPEIIAKNGQNAKVRRLTDEEYLRKLDEKLGEELAEYLADGNVEELADLLEVIYAAALARGCPAEQLDEIRRRKAMERGVFEARLLLEEVSE